MASPSDYVRDRGTAQARRVAANDVGGAPISPIREASPEADDAPVALGMVSRSDALSWLPDAYIDVLAENEDLILRRGPEGLKLYDDLLDDETAMSTLQQRRLAITSRDWEVTPGDPDDERSVLAADDLRAMIDGLDFDRVTGGLHYALWYGYAVGEGIYEIRQHDGRTLVWLTDIVIPDRRHFGFTRAGELRYTATLAGDLGGEKLPDNKFVTLRTGATHDFAFYGLGLAHWLYWPIFFKRAALRFWALYLEKFGGPTVGIEFDEGQANDKAAKAKLLNAASSITRDSAVTLPKGYITENRVKLFEGTRSGTGASSYRDFLNEQNEAIMRVVLGQPGTSKGVSSGLNSDQASEHADVKAEIVKADSDLISGALRRTFARWLTTWNHGADVAAPNVFRVLDDAEDQNKVAERDATLDGIGIKRTEESVREVYGDGYVVDRMSEQEKADREDALAAAQAAPRAPAAQNDDDAPARAATAFSAADEAAIERLAAAMVEETHPAFIAMADHLRGALEGVESADAARVAILQAAETLPLDRVARLMALPMVAERAGALAGAEDDVTA